MPTEALFLIIKQRRDSLFILCLLYFINFGLKYRHRLIKSLKRSFESPACYLLICLSGDPENASVECDDFGFLKE
jgi:hypothetical protein